MRDYPKRFVNFGAELTTRTNTAIAEAKRQLTDSHREATLVSSDGRLIYQFEISIEIECFD